MNTCTLWWYEYIFVSAGEDGIYCGINYVCMFAIVHVAFVLILFWIMLIKVSIKEVIAVAVAVAATWCF